MHVRLRCCCLLRAGLWGQGQEWERGVSLLSLSLSISLSVSVCACECVSFGVA